MRSRPQMAPEHAFVSRPGIRPEVLFPRLRPWRDKGPGVALSDVSGVVEYHYTTPSIALVDPALIAEDALGRCPQPLTCNRHTMTCVQCEKPFQAGTTRAKRCPPCRAIYEREREAQRMMDRAAAIPRKVCECGATYRPLTSETRCPDCRCARLAQSRERLNAARRAAQRAKAETRRAGGAL